MIGVFVTFLRVVYGTMIYMSVPECVIETTDTNTVYCG